MPSDDGATRGPIPLGPVGGYLIANLEELRNRRRLTYKDLSDRLSGLGRPIPTLGLSRIEKGNRRVDVDDLIALAIALDVNPVSLLIPVDVGPDTEIELTAGLRVPAQVARDWAGGRIPLPDHDAITWPRAPVVYAIRESDLEDVQRQLDFLRSGLDATRPQREAAELARRPIPLEEGEDRPIVAAIVVAPGRGVLVSHRREGRPPWGFITGEIEPDESPRDAAEREVKEETGLEVRAGRVIGERNPHPITGKHVIYMTATPVHGTDVFVGDEAELDDVRWVSLAEANELLPTMFEPVRKHLALELGEA